MTKTIFMQISLLIVVCVWDCDAARIQHTPTTLPQAVAGHTILGGFSDDISTYNVVKESGTSPDSSTLDVSLFELNAPVTEKLSTSISWRLRAHGSLYDESGCDSSFLVIVEKDSFEKCTYDNKSIFVETHATLAPGNGVVADANFAQIGINKSGKFSAEGIAKYSELAGKPINTVDDLAGALQSGAIKPSQVPVDYVVVEGQNVILNTRTSTALSRGGINQADWFGINKTGVEVPGMAGTTFDDLALQQTIRNKLPITGTPQAPK